MKTILIDTSVWVEYFKGSKTVAEIIHDKHSHSVYIVGPVITELIQGMKTESEKESFATSLKSLPRLEITDQDWFDAGLAGALLRRKGTTVPLANLIIYTNARNNRCSIYTLEKHFKLINSALSGQVEIFGIQV